MGVRNKPGTQTPPITVINSGEKLDVLENDGKYSRIKTSKGAEGWVRNTYLSKTPPAKLRVAKLEAKYKTAQSEILELQNQLTAANGNNSELGQKIKLLDEDNYDLHQKLATLDPSNDRTWIYVLITIITSCGLAFTLGILWDRQRVAKKLGGQKL